MRLDKLLTSLHFGSRNTIKRLLHSKQVTVDGVIITKAGQNVDAMLQDIRVNGRKLCHQTHLYYMMNKPAGVISAVTDKRLPTVMDLLESTDYRKGLYPVGRLDRDTQGLLLLTDNGQLGYQLLRPNKHVTKRYEVKVNGLVTAEDCAAFQAGIIFHGGIQCQPAQLEVLAAASSESHVILELREGKFHQVKKMFLAVGKKVTFLKRIQMGPLILDPALASGGYRALNDEELRQLLPYFTIEKQQSAQHLG
ncbi:16S rRNA pseudouridine(516) synthase [Enterococcus faecalis]